MTLEAGLCLEIGQSGIHNLPSGYYVYAGSALNGLSSRLKRHLRSEKRLHWHIDYLLQKAEITQIWYTLSPDKLECQWNAILSNLPGAAPSIYGFGASDCRCYSHLTYFQIIPSFDLFKHKSEQNNLPQVHHLNDFISIAGI